MGISLKTKFLRRIAALASFDMRNLTKPVNVWLEGAYPG